MQIARGFSIVELLIAMVLGSIVIIGIVQLFVANSATYKVLVGQSLLAFFLHNCSKGLSYWGGRGFGSVMLTLVGGRREVETRSVQRTDLHWTG